MKMWPDCIPCILRMGLSVARNAVANEEDARNLFKEIIGLPCFSAPPWHISPPLVIRDVYRTIVERSGLKDPLREVKQKQNEKALALLPAARDIVANSNDRLREAMRIAILGNTIDILAHGVEKDASSLLGAAGSASLPGEETGAFLGKLEKAKKLLYLGDNCGEVVFDSLFIETIRSLFDVEVVFITRKIPVLNDATLEDAITAGVDRVASAMDNGVSDPIPGTLLSAISPEVHELVRDADLIISKGGGNYDLLTDENSLRGKITFLVEAKCFPYCSIHRSRLGELIVYNF